MTRPSQPVEILTNNEAALVLAAFSRRSTTGVRNRAMLSVMWRSGLRSAEVCALQMGDIDMDEGTIHVRHGKGDESRRVDIHYRSRKFIGAWIGCRERMKVRSECFFCTRAGTEVRGQYLRRVFARAGRDANLDKRVYPHVFRHMFAVDLNRRGVPIAVISERMGHANIIVTAQYLAHLDPRAVI